MARPKDDKPSQEWHESESPEMVELDQSTILALASQYVPGSREEKALLRKIDMRLIVSAVDLTQCALTDKSKPCVWLLFVMGYLDKANIGNAKTAGLATDFNLTSNQYSVILLVFFVSYVLFEVPSNLLIARARPSLYLSGIAVLWGIIAACMAATQNWQQLAGVRLVLGFVESGFAPGVAFYLSSWYRRYELASRFAVYYTAVAVSGGCSGLIAGLVTQHLDGARGIAGWRWLFVRILLFSLMLADTISDHRRSRLILRWIDRLVLHGGLAVYHEVAHSRRASSRSSTTGIRRARQHAGRTWQNGRDDCAPYGCQ
jgi:MFS family permease